jgi:DNA-binding transcriptional MerR regulator/quercetin dioxygenase-like cupin family protein
MPDREARSKAPATDQPPDDQVPAGGVYVRQVATMLGVSTSSVRAWETEGLVSPRRSRSGYRLYTMDDVRRLTKIRDLREQGINVAGVRKMLEDETQPPRPAPTMEEDGLGTRLKNLRVASGASLREFATRTGLSASYISSVERSVSSPSIASLQKIAAALGTNIPGLLGGSEEDAEQEVVRAGARPVLQPRQDGVTLHRLAVNETMLEPLLFTIEPGGGSQEPYAHDGEEFIIVTEGTFEITLDGQFTHRLEVGDSITFRSRRSHSFVNPGHTTCVVVWVNTPPTF